MNSNPKNIIKFWASVERYTPYEVETKKKIGNVESIQKEVLNDYDITWLNKDRFGHYITENYTWNYIIFLGILDFDSIALEMKRLLKVECLDYDLQKSNSVSCVACFKVNFDGKPLRESLEIPDYFIGISSLILYGENYRGWDENKNEVVRRKIIDIFHNYCDELNHPTNQNPVIFKDLNFLLRSFIKVSGWLSIMENNYIRNVAVIHGIKVKIPKPKPNGTFEEIKDENNSILNSFYLDDLLLISKKIKEKSPEESNIGAALKQYLGIISNNKREDLVKEIKYLKEYTGVNLLPPCRWPGKGNFPLSLAQQLAVNLSLKEKEGIFSVNGPPGTGKTTLLRDIISNIIVNRAKQLANLSHPNDAYIKPKDVKVDHYNYKAWHLIPELMGHEIFVASCNNAAIENISKEIPRKTEIDESFQLSYFSEIASYVMGEESWGLGAAPLGNKKNRSDFFNKFWSKKPKNDHDLEDDFGLEYLLSNFETAESWQNAKSFFLDELHLFEKYQKELLSIENIINEIPAQILTIENKKSDVDRHQNYLSGLEIEKDELEIKIKNIQSRIEKQKSLLSSIKNITPSFIESIFSHRGISCFCCRTFRTCSRYCFRDRDLHPLAVINRSAKAVHFCLITLHP